MLREPLRSLFANFTLDLVLLLFFFVPASSTLKKFYFLANFGQIVCMCYHASQLPLNQLMPCEELLVARDGSSRCDLASNSLFENQLLKRLVLKWCYSQWCNSGATAFPGVQPPAYETLLFMILIHTFFFFFFYIKCKKYTGWCSSRRESSRGTGQLWRRLFRPRFGAWSLVVGIRGVETTVSVSLSVLVEQVGEVGGDLVIEGFESEEKDLELDVL